MKIRFIYSILLVVFFYSGNKNVLAQSPTWQWANNLGSNLLSFQSDYGNSVAIDDSGNVYSTGHFSGTVDFDPGSGVYNLTGSGNYDVYILKLSVNGNFIWAKRIGASGYDDGHSIAIDGSGNILVAGSFENSVDFDPGPSTFTLSSSAYRDFFELKLSSNGNFIWVIKIGGVDFDWCYSIAIDKNGNSLLTGNFVDIVDFNPGIGIFNLTSLSGEIFILKLDSNGNFLWAKNFGDTTSTSTYGSQGLGIDVDIFGNVYATGSYDGTMDADPGLGISQLIPLGLADIFIIKLAPSGNFIWAKTIGGVSDEQGSSISIDSSGNVLSTGFFKSTVDFDPGSGIYNLTSNSLGCGFGCTYPGAYILKLDSNGNFIWAKPLISDGSGSCNGLAITTDKYDNVFTTGNFSNSVDFDPGSNSFSITAVGGTDIFLSKLDASGNFIYGITNGGGNLESGQSLAVNKKGELVTTGFFASFSIAFNSDTIYNAGMFGGSYDIFISKINCSTYANLNVSSCGNYFSPSGNHTWLISGIYLDTIPNNSGCDSIININLTINNATTSTVTESGCNNYLSPSGIYIWTSSGIYLDTIPNALGCDSVITINLTINNSASTSSTITPVTCFNYTSPSGNYTWSTSGIYHDTIPNAASCDSIITINLTVNTPNNAVTVSGVTLTSNQTAATYQWLDCNSNFSIIAGATNQTFIATANGDFAVDIIKNSCRDTSICYTVTGVGITDIYEVSSFAIYPNPAQNDLTIYSTQLNEYSIEIFDLLGRVLSSELSNEKSKTINLNSFSSGLYMVKIKTGHSTETKKLSIVK